MDNRAQSFIRKFSDTQKFLGITSVHNIVSLKYRDNAVSYRDYDRFVEEGLKRELGFEIKEVKGDFQGRAWLVTDRNDNSVILVEHETGLEILYIAGSIASLLSVIPMINSGWKYIRSRFFEWPSFRNGAVGVEKRTIDSKNQLVEERVGDIEGYILSESLAEISVLRKRVNQLEQEMKKIKTKNGASKKTIKTTKKRKR